MLISQGVEWIKQQDEYSFICVNFSNNIEKMMMCVEMINKSSIYFLWGDTKWIKRYFQEYYCIWYLQIPAISVFLKRTGLSIFSFQLQICCSLQHSPDSYPSPQKDKNLMWSEFLISQQSQACLEALPGSVSSENNVCTFHYRTEIRLNAVSQVSMFPGNS